MTSTWIQRVKGSMDAISVPTWIGGLWTAFYFGFAVAKPSIVASKSLRESVRRILSKTHGLYSRYFPNIFVMNGLVMTAAAPYLRPATAIRWAHQVVKASDGGSFMLAWVRLSDDFEESVASNTPILFVLPGLTGDETEWYIQNVIGHATEVLGWRAVVYVRRGCQIPLTGNSKCQDYADGSKWPDGDLRTALDCVREKYPNAPILGAGYSLGSNYLVSHLGSAGASSPFVAASAIGCPFDLVGASYWTKHVNRIVGRAITSNRKKLYV